MFEPIKSLKGLVPNIQGVTAKVREHVQQIQAQIEALAQERDELLKQPLSRGDYADVLCRQIDLKADLYKDQVARRIRADVTEFGARNHIERLGRHVWPATVESANNEDHLQRMPGLIVNFRNVEGDCFDNREMLQGAANFLLRDEMKRAAREAVEAVDPWPFPEAKPLDDVRARLASIDAEFKTLVAQLGEVQQAAAEAGISLPEFSMPSTKREAPFEIFPGAMQQRKRSVAESHATQYCRDYQERMSEELIEKIMEKMGDDPAQWYRRVRP